MAGEEGIRVSMAAAQNKLPVYIENGTMSVPTGSSSSIYILKPAIPDLEEGVENDFCCMRLAGRMGLPVPNVVIRRNSDTLLVVTLCDREKRPDSAIQRLHPGDI